MLNTFHKLIKLAFLFSAVISGWTSIVLMSSTTFNLEIKELITEMYMNQKNFLFNVQELSVLLVKDANERFSEENPAIMRFNNSQID